MQQVTVKQRYRGVIIPMVTPLDEQGSIDQAAVRSIARYLLAHRCVPFVAGTTGESASLTDEHKTDLVRATVAAVAGKELVYAGIADNCLEASVRKAQVYKTLGADVAVCHLPEYYPLDQTQMQDWLSKLADRC